MTLEGIQTLGNLFRMLEVMGRESIIGGLQPTHATKLIRDKLKLLT